MAAPTIPNGEEHFFPIIYEGNGAGQRVGKFVPFTDNGTIDNSCIFNDGDSAQLERTPSSNGNRRTFTVSAWVKRGALGTEQHICSSYDGSSSDNNSMWEFRFLAANTISISRYTDNILITNRTFEDTSKFYHLLMAVDTTQGTASNRVKLYVDGDEVTSFGTDVRSAVAQDFDTAFNNTADACVVGNRKGDSKYFDGYMAEVNLVDGTALTPDTFGLTDTSTGRWIPKALTGITYGTNGFRLQFGSSSALGDDTSGNENDFSVSNLVAGDQTTDSPTQNHATFSPNRTANSPTLSEGNLSITAPSSNYGKASIEKIFNSNISSGLYWEYTDGSTNGFEGGIIKSSKGKPQTSEGETDGVILQRRGSGGGNTYWIKKNDSDYADTSVSHSSGDKIGIAVKDNKIWFAVNNTWVLSGDPSNGTNPASTLDDTSYMAMLGCYGSTTVSANFGQKSFTYTPPTGFVALQQDNLPETSKGVSGLVWIKNRDASANNSMQDSSRGSTQMLYPDLTTQEITVIDGVQKFLKGGFQMEDDTLINTSGNSYVSWNWVANGGTTASNGDGSLTSTVQANTTAGFSIVQWTGDGGQSTVGHGLSSTPTIVIQKNLDSTSDWWFYTTAIDGSYDYLKLNTTDAKNDYSATAPTSTVFTSHGWGTTSMIGYCFHGVEGFSKFGSYTGNGDTDGAFVYTGFKPAFVMVKQSSSSGNNWSITDSKRDPFNPTDKGLLASTNGAEGTGYTFDFLSNGFKLRLTGTALNGSGSTYFYMAFAEHPFVGDGTNPVTAR